MPKYKKYEKYKDSGVEWIGDVPNHWILSRLKYTTNDNFMYGANESAELDDVNLPRYIRITDIDDYGNLKEDTFKSMEKEKAKDFLLKDKDILFARSGATVGKTHIYKQEIGEACFAGYLIRYRANRHCINPKYIYYLTKTTGYDNWIKLNTIQATIQNVSADKYKNLEVPLLEIKEQDQIVNFLDKKISDIDSLVSDKEKLITLLEEKRQAIITEVVTKGLNSDVKMKTSGVNWIGNIPEHWNTIKIKYIVRQLSCKSIDADDLKYLGLEHIEKATGNIIQGYEDMVIKSEGEALKYFKGNVLFGKLRPYLKKCVVASTNGKCTSELLVLDTKESINSEYLKYVMLDGRFINEVNSSTYGAKMPRANWEFIRNIEIILPSLQEQEKIVEYILKTDEEFKEVINETVLSIEKYKEYRQSLISEVVTGKIDVRNYNKGI